MLLIILFAVIIATIGYLFGRRVKQMSILERNGIPGPKPSLISGNIFDYFKLPSIEREKDWIQKYGKVVGYYMGAKPTVLVADPDLAKDIQIKNFQYFADRRHKQLKDGINAHPVVNSMLTELRGKRWKEVRSALTPTFSGSKLKTMSPIITSAIDNLIDIIDRKSKSGDEFDIYDMFQNLTTDVIGRTAFGIQSDVQNAENNKFLDAAKQIFNTKLNQWIVLVIQCFPILDVIIYPFRRLQTIIQELRGQSASGLLTEMARNIVELRKSNSNLRRKDLLQLMLDTKMSSQEMSEMSYDRMTAGNDNDIHSNGHQNGVTNAIKSNKNDFTLTDDEVIANCVLFYEAGYETTSTALGFMSHILVNNPDVQQQIREEVQELYKKDGKLDFNTVTKLDLMNCVLNETMRLYPPVISFVSRECIKDYKYKDITIPKGATIQLATHYLHHDPDYWPEPEVFDPSRFSSDRKHEIHPSSWQPFGSGPRNCIGMRFALFEAKLALSKLLIKYRLVPGSKTEMGELTTDVKFITLTPKNGVYVKAIEI